MPRKHIDSPSHKATRKTDAVKAIAEVEIEHTKQAVNLPPEPPVLQPAPPSPAVLALEIQVIDLITSRGQMQREVLLSQARLRQMESEVRTHLDTLRMVEEEVQYRMGIIAQLSGRPMPQISAPQNFFAPSSYPAELRIQDANAIGRGPIPGQVPYIAPGSIAGGMGSIPASRPIYPGDGSEVRSESADEFRRAL